MPLDPNANITRFTGLAFDNAPGSPTTTLNYPNLTTTEIAAIDVDQIDFGASVFATDIEEIMTFTAAGFWLPILTAESDITVNFVSGTVQASGVSALTVLLDTAAGTGATSLITGSVMSGQFRLNTGTSPSGSIIGTFTIPTEFLDQLSGAYGIVFYPASLTTAAFPTYVTTSSPSNLFLFGVGSGTLAASTAYFWNYHILGTRKEDTTVAGLIKAKKAALLNQ